jgi:hypothetical protein
MIRRNWVIPPTRAASGWMKATERRSMSRRCSAVLVSISPVAIAVSSLSASMAWAS